MSSPDTTAAIGFVGFPLAEYVFTNGVGLALTTAGGSGWIGQYAQDGVSQQLVSGLITQSGETTALEFMLTGPGVVAFDWKRDSDIYYNGLIVYLDGSPVWESPMTVNPDWAAYSLPINVASEEETTTVRIVYVKAGAGSGLDCAWVRNLTWTPSVSERLSAPQGVSASDAGLIESVRVSWNAVPDATHYRVWRATTSSGADRVMVSNGWQDGTNLIDSAPVLWNGQAFWYFVEAAASASGAQASLLSQPDQGSAIPRAGNDWLGNAFELTPAVYGVTTGTCAGATVHADEPVHAGVASATNSVWWKWTATRDGPERVSVQGAGTNLPVVVAVYTNAGGMLSLSTLVEVRAGVMEENGWASAEVPGVAGQTYYIAVAGGGGAGGPVALAWEAVWSKAAPSNVRVTQGTLFEKIVVEWVPVPDATHYEVWRQTNPQRPESLKVGTWQTGCVFEDATARIGVTYYYAVRATVGAVDEIAGAFSGPVAGYAGSRPPNDNRVSAGALTGLCGQAQGNSALAVAEPGEPLHAGAAGAVNSVWWTWTAPADASFTFTATPQTNAAWRPVLAVYTNAVDGGGLLPVAHGVAGTDGAKAQAAFDAAAGGTYYVAVAGGDGAGGTFALEWALSLAPPAGVTATEGTAFWVTVIEWEEVAGATRYEVSRAETPDGEKVNLSGWITGRRFEDWTGELAVPYYYFVRAGTEAWGGIESGYSQPLAGWAGDFPPNDDRADAELLEGASGSVPGNSLWATREPGEPQHNGFSDAGHSVWWRWMAPVSAPVTFAARGDGGFDAVVAVYADASGGALAPVAAASGGGASDAELTFGVQSGTEYWIAVAGRPDAGGPVTLEWSYGGWVFPAPSGVAATQAATDGRIEVTWNPVAEATVYEVSRATSADGVKTVVMAWSDELAFVDADVAAGQRYYYFVRAAWDASATLAGVYGGPAEGWIKDDEPPVPPAISGFSPVTLAGGPGFRFTLAVQAGVTYEVVTADELGGGAAWRPLAPPVRAVAADDGPIHLDVPFDAARPRGFFKIEASR